MNVVGSAGPSASDLGDQPLNLIGSGPSTSELRVAEPRKTIYIYISNLDPHTSTEQVSTVISTKFGINPLMCTKLVAADRNLDALQFVSFKVIVPEKLFAKFLDANLWPNGVIVREFIQKSKNVKNTAVRL